MCVCVHSHFGFCVLCNVAFGSETFPFIDFSYCCTTRSPWGGNLSFPFQCLSSAPHSPLILSAFIVVEFVFFPQTLQRLWRYTQCNLQCLPLIPTTFCHQQRLLPENSSRCMNNYSTKLSEINLLTFQLVHFAHQCIVDRIEQPSGSLINAFPRLNVQRTCEYIQIW